MLAPAPGLGVPIGAEKGVRSPVLDDDYVDLISTKIVLGVALSAQGICGVC